MAFAGGVGVELSLDSLAEQSGIQHPAILLFSESNTRFLVEVLPRNALAFEDQLSGLPFVRVGTTTDDHTLQVLGSGGKKVIDVLLNLLKDAWRKPLAWDEV